MLACHCIRCYPFILRVLCAKCLGNIIGLSLLWSELFGDPNWHFSYWISAGAHASESSANFFIFRCTDQRWMHSTTRKYRCNRIVPSNGRVHGLRNSHCFVYYYTFCSCSGSPFGQQWVANVHICIMGTKARISHSILFVFWMCAHFLVCAIYNYTCNVGKATRALFCSLAHHQPVIGQFVFL